MKPQTCCCHICKTSLNQYKREFMGCSECNKIVCKNCFGTKYRGQTWEEAFSQKPNWLCPSCNGTCCCPRCKKLPKVKLPGIANTEEFKRDVSKENSIVIEELKFQSKQVHPRIRDTLDFALDKLTPKIEKVVLLQLQELAEKEKRAEANIREMEKLLNFMQQERQDIIHEKQKLEALVEESYPTSSESKSPSYNSDDGMPLFEDDSSSNNEMDLKDYEEIEDQVVQGLQFSRQEEIMAQ